MVAYSFKKRFVWPIKVGLGAAVPDSFGMPLPKLQTIRADRKRHARPGEELQLYYGMRTKHCFLIGSARCTSVRAVVLTLEARGCVAIGGTDGEPSSHYSGGGLDTFAQMDGFANWTEMLSFWDVPLFIGVLIEWTPLN